ENRASGLTFEPVEIGALARRTVRDWVQAALAKRMDLGYEGPEDDAPLDVDGNPVMLREMLGNLVDNAIRYTPEGGRITVRVRAE
ncbi:ATP-binding protein, partial [Paraburkholderia sp. SIMBA_030]